MAISALLEQKLLEVLGDEAGRDMLEWMRDIEARHAILYGADRRPAEPPPRPDLPSSGMDRRV
jgi:hypothetical protein